MASLFDFLFDCLPIAIAHNGAHYAAPGDRRTTIREALKRATLGELRQQMLRLTSVRPPTLQGPGIDPDGLGRRLWTLGIGTDVASVGRGTCMMSGQDYDEMVVFEKIEWGREINGSVAPFVEVTDIHDSALELPLTDEFLLDEWLVVSGTHVATDAIDMFPLEARPDVGLVRVFMYELDTDTMEIVPLDPAGFDVAESAGWDRYRRAAALLDSSLPGGGDLDVLVGEDLCAFDPFFSHEEYEAIGGMIHFDDVVPFAVQRPRFLVALSIQLCKELEDFEPGKIIGMAKFHPSVLVTSSITLKRVESSVSVVRPLRTTNLTKPGHCGCSEMHEEVRTLLVADANRAETLYPGPGAAIPYWGNLFSYYLTDPDVSHPGREWEMVRPLVGGRDAQGYIERMAPAAAVELRSDLTSKVAGQGDFDNVHLAPRMHLRAASHVRRNRDRFTSMATPWREIRPSDALALDPVAMAPFCAHDCMHWHSRWSDASSARHVLGWSRDPKLIEMAGGELTSEFFERCRARVAKPNAEAGAPLFPPWHAVTARVETARVMLSLKTVVPTMAGQREILFHAPWAYGVNMGFWLSLFAGLAVSLGKTGRLQFELGKRTKGGLVEEIHPSTSFASFYWWVRYRSVLHEDDCHEARDYHHHKNLEGAIRL